MDAYDETAEENSQSQVTYTYSVGTIQGNRRFSGFWPASLIEHTGNAANLGRL
jgi:hypothetical protein